MLSGFVVFMALEHLRDGNLQVHILSTHGTYIWNGCGRGVTCGWLSFLFIRDLVPQIWSLSQTTLSLRGDRQSFLQRRGQLPQVWCLSDC